MIASNSNLGRIINFIDGRIKLNYDFFLVLTGEEGVGKSRGLFLNIVDYWYSTILRKPIPKYSFAVSLQDFTKNLKKGERGELKGLDEAGDSMDTQEYANRINRALYKAYTIIREKGFFSIVVLPSFFDLNPRFRKRRVRLLIHAYKRVDNKCKSCGKSFVGDVCPCGSTDFKAGYVCWRAYNRKKLRQIIERNQYRQIKSLNVGVKPLADGIVREYKGKLLVPYKIMKDKKVKEALIALNRDVADVHNIKVCTHDWRYYKKWNYWQCRKCGGKTTSNPFSDVGDVDGVGNE